MWLVDENHCVGCGICTTVCSEWIELEMATGCAHIVHENRDCLEKAMRACPQHAIMQWNGKLVFAIGTDDGITIKSDDHVGMSGYFQILEYQDSEMIFKEKRENPKYKEDDTRIHGDPGKAKATASALQGVDVLVGKIMGPNIIRLKNRFVCVIVREVRITDAIRILKENLCAILFEKNKKDDRERYGIVLR